MDKILASPGFATPGRHSRLLRHLLSMTLEGRSEEIKDYALDVDLFGRGEFIRPPATDAIVRTEVSRLRAKLKTYYSGDGDSVVVDLPARSYVPAFKLREAPVEVAYCRGNGGGSGGGCFSTPSHGPLDPAVDFRRVRDTSRWCRVLEALLKEIRESRER